MCKWVYFQRLEICKIHVLGACQKMRSFKSLVFCYIFCTMCKTATQKTRTIYVMFFLSKSKNTFRYVTKLLSIEFQINSRICKGRQCQLFIFYKLASNRIFIISRFMEIYSVPRVYPTKNMVYSSWKPKILLFENVIRGLVLERNVHEVDCLLEGRCDWFMSVTFIPETKSRIKFSLS